VFGMGKRKKPVKKVVKERLPVAPPTKQIPDPRKEEQKRKCRKKVEEAETDPIADSR